MKPAPRSSASPDSLATRRSKASSHTNPKEQSLGDAPLTREPASASPHLSRRSFLGGVGGATAALTAGGVILPAITGSNSARASGPVPGTGADRKNLAFRVRYNAALAHFDAPVVDHPDNGDEALYANKIGSFSKGLPHNSSGEVDLTAYQSLITAVQSGDPADFEAIISGCPNPSQRLKLVNPQSGLACDMEGADGQEMVQDPAPAFASAEEAGEIVENYWMAILRDVPFTDYGTSTLAAQAASDLSAMSDFRGPKSPAGQVTTSTMFRSNYRGALLGPYLAQFWWKSQPFGAQYIVNQIRTAVPGIDYLTTETDWLSVQNGFAPSGGPVFDTTRRYIRNGRDLSQWVHMDVLYQAYFQAALFLSTPPDPSDPITGGGLGCPLNPGNPYNDLLMQVGFGTFGGPYFATILTEVATRALKAVWFQKWFVHRRLRPEEFGGAIHYKLAHGQPYPIHSDVLNSAGLANVFSQYGTYFLPQAFKEGCPIHPSYGAGHATVAGACVTILKALFDEHFVIPNPVVPTTDGLSLVPYTGPDAGSLTVGGELTKLASNVAFGRNVAGVHWRSDGTESLKLGEAIAISVLQDQRKTYNEDFNGFTFTKFDGTVVTI
jgi:hypothetical protein